MVTPQPARPRDLQWRPCGATARELAVLGLCLLLAGCATPPPPSPTSAEVRQEATRAESSARIEYRERNWVVAGLLFQRAADNYGRLGEVDAEALARYNQAQSLRQAGHHDAAIAVYTQSLRLNENQGRWEQQAENLGGIAQSEAALNRFDEAIETMEIALEVARDFPRTLATLQNDLGLMLLQRRHPADAVRIFEVLTTALRLNQEWRTTPYVAATRLNLGRACIEFDRLDAAQAHLDQALEGFRAVGDTAGLGHVHEALGHLALARGDAAAAEQQFALARDQFAALKDETALQRLQQAGP